MCIHKHQFCRTIGGLRASLDIVFQHHGGLEAAAAATICVCGASVVNEIGRCCYTSVFTRIKLNDTSKRAIGINFELLSLSLSHVCILFDIIISECRCVFKFT